MSSIKIDPTSHVLSRFNNAVFLVAALIPRTVDESLPQFMQISCLENWFTNYRLLIEFLVGRPPPNCARASTYVPTWKPDATIKKSLLREYGWASQDVSHIGMPRTIDHDDYVLPPTLRDKAKVLFSIVGQFADGLYGEDNDYASFVHDALNQAKRELESQG